MAYYHFELVWKCESTSCPSARTQNPGKHPLPAFHLWAPLFAIRGCLLLAVLAWWLCGWFWTCSKYIVVQAGGSSAPHMWLQLTEGKSLVPEGHCHCLLAQKSHRADATQIRLIFTAWSGYTKKGGNLFMAIHTPDSERRQWDWKYFLCFSDP